MRVTDRNFGLIGRFFNALLTVRQGQIFFWNIQVVVGVVTFLNFYITFGLTIFIWTSLSTSFPTLRLISFFTSGSIAWIKRHIITIIRRVWWARAAGIFTVLFDVSWLLSISLSPNAWIWRKWLTSGLNFYIISLLI